MTDQSDSPDRLTSDASSSPQDGFAEGAGAASGADLEANLGNAGSSRGRLSPNGLFSLSALRRAVANDVAPRVKDECDLHAARLADVSANDAGPALADALLSRAAAGTVINTGISEDARRVIAAGELYYPGSPSGDMAHANFVQALLQGERTLHDYCAQMRPAEMSFKTFCDELIMPAAYALDHLWMDDAIDFIDVTVGLTHLRGLVLNWVEANCPTPRDDGKHRAVFARIDGEAHTLGVLLVGVRFEQAGWTLFGGNDLVMDARTISMIAQTPVDLVGLSIGCRTNIATVQDVVAQIRKVSANRDVKIAIGGAVLTPGVDVRAAVGADFAAADADAAVDMVEAAIAGSGD